MKFAKRYFTNKEKMIKDKKKSKDESLRVTKRCQREA